MTRLAQILAIGVALITLTGCSLPWERPTSSTSPRPPAIPHCVQLLSQAMLSTTGTVVVGAYACIDPAYTARLAANGGPDSDAALAKIAQSPPLFTSVQYVGKTSLGYYFQYSGVDGPGCFRFHANLVGHVDRIAYGHVTCPKPLV